MMIIVRVKRFILFSYQFYMPSGRHITWYFEIVSWLNRLGTTFEINYILKHFKIFYCFVSVFSAKFIGEQKPVRVAGL